MYLTDKEFRLGDGCEITLCNQLGEELTLTKGKVTFEAPKVKHDYRHMKCYGGSFTLEPDRKDKKSVSKLLNVTK